MAWPSNAGYLSSLNYPGSCDTPEELSQPITGFDSGSGEASFDLRYSQLWRFALDYLRMETAPYLSSGAYSTPWYNSAVLLDVTAHPEWSSFFEEEFGNRNPADYWLVNRVAVKVHGPRSVEGNLADTLSLDVNGNVSLTSPPLAWQSWTDWTGALTLAIRAMYYAVEILSARFKWIPRARPDGIGIFTALHMKLTESVVFLEFADSVDYSDGGRLYTASGIGRTVTLVRSWVYEQLSLLISVKNTGTSCSGPQLRARLEELAKLVGVMAHEVGHTTFSWAFGLDSGIGDVYRGPDFRVYQVSGDIVTIPIEPFDGMPGFAPTLNPFFTWPSVDWAGIGFPHQFRHWVLEWIEAACAGLLLADIWNPAESPGQQQNRAIAAQLDETHRAACRSDDDRYEGDC